jgi:hypothetical protein
MRMKCNNMYFVVASVVVMMALFWGGVPVMADSVDKTLESPAGAEMVRQTEVSIKGDMFYINERPTYEGRTWRGHKIEGLLMNARLVQGIFDDLNPQTISRWAYPDTGVWDADRNTSEFITAMPTWREHGLLSFTINLQGGSPEGYSRAQPWHNSALRADGSLHAEYMNRLERILDRADELGMVPILGIYYFGQDGRLEDEAAVIRGVENTVNWVLEKGYRNVLIEINNECNVRYKTAILQPPRVHELIDLAKKITRNGRRLYVSTSYGGGTVPKENVMQVADFILLHGNGVRDPKRMAEMIRTVREMDAYQGQPIVNNEDDQPWREEQQGWGDEDNNFAVCAENYASWGYFDFRRTDEDFNEGFQSVPVNWQISSERKRAFFGLMSRITGVGAYDAHRIQPYSENPYYWQYKGEPVLLVGGSWQDNLFNHPIGLEDHLDRLVSAGGNYVRNTMSHRNQGNVFAYTQLAGPGIPLEQDGKFDLEAFNEDYWIRLDDFLRMTYERDIVVQIEVFDPHDHFRDHQSLGGWSKHPFNPANNINYTPEESKLPTTVNYRPTATPSTHPFWLTVPGLQNNELVLRYQQAYVDKLLSITLAYPHVLYTIQNESGEELAFGDYWADYIHCRARESGRTVYVTDMRRTGDVREPDQRHIMASSQRFNFLDISQSVGNYERTLFVREHIAKNPRPINSVKLYNTDGEEESVARMFRFIFAGGASARFHRPHPHEGSRDHEKSSRWGLGLSPRAQSTIRSMRILTNSIHVFTTEPRNDLLTDREENEAYCLAEPGKQYAIYFPDGGEVKLDVSDAKGGLMIKWLNISKSEWSEEKRVSSGDSLTLKAPGEGHWAALVQAQP